MRTANFARNEFYVCGYSVTESEPQEYSLILSALLQYVFEFLLLKNLLNFINNKLKILCQTEGIFNKSV